MDVQSQKPIRLNPQEREILSYAFEGTLVIGEDYSACIRVIAKLDEQIAVARSQISTLQDNIREWRRARQQLRLVAR